MLTIALLWYDDDTRRPLPQKIRDATSRYRERLGAAPTVCHLNPSQAEQALRVSPRKQPEPLPVRLEADDTMRPNYFLVGLDDEDAPGQPLPTANAFFDDSDEQVRPRRVKSAPAASARTRTARRTPGAAVPAVAPTPAPATPRPQSRTRSPAASHSKSGTPARDTSPKNLSSSVPGPVSSPARKRRTAAARQAELAAATAPAEPAPRHRATRGKAATSAAPIAFQPTLLDSVTAKPSRAHSATPRGRTRRAS